MVQQRCCFTVAPVEERARVFLERLQPRPRVLAVELRGRRCAGHAAPVRRMARISVGQHREQLRIRVTCWRATKVQAPEVIWNLLVATRVAVVVVVDDHRHDEAATA